jgi:hypothetical protein
LFFSSNTDLLSVMIKHGADISQNGWLKIDEDWWFGTPLELTLFMESSGKDVEEMKNQLISANESKWNQLGPTGNSKLYFYSNHYIMKKE